MIEKVVDYIRNEAGKRFDAQIQIYGIREVNDLTETFNEDCCKALKEEFNKNIKEGEAGLSVDDIFIIFNEIGPLHIMTY